MGDLHFFRTVIKRNVLLQSIIVICMFDVNNIENYLYVFQQLS